MNAEDTIVLIEHGRVMERKACVAYLRGMYKEALSKGFAEQYRVLLRCTTHIENSSDE